MSADAAQPSSNPRVAAHQARTGVLNVLVVDDQRTSRLLIDHVLKQIGHRTAGCSNADRAIDHLHKHCYDLVVIDVHMPGMDGHQLAETIRTIQTDANGTPASVPILFVSADAASCAAISAGIEGATACLAKPVLSDALVGAIEALRGHAA